MYTKILLMIAFLVVAATPFASAEEINPVLGKVGDFTIRETDLDRLIASQPTQAQKQLQEKPELKITLVRNILLSKAIAMKARNDGYDKKPEFRERLSLLIDDYLSNEYMEKVVVADNKISENELKKYYQDHEKDFLLAETVKARHIFIQAAEKATAEEKSAARAKAEVILARLKKGEDFAKVAAEVSEDADSAKKGGELGLIAPGKTNAAEFEKAAFALKSGEISAVVETPFGLHIIKADEKTAPRTATLDESRGYIEAALKKEHAQNKSAEFIEKLLKESGLEVFEQRIVPSSEAPGNKSEK